MGETYDANREPRLRRIADWIALSGLFAFFVGIVTLVTGVSLAVSPTRIAFSYIVVAILGSLVVRIMAASPQRISRRSYWARVAMTVLAVTAPLAAVLFLRLGFETCVIINPLGLPWPSAFKTTVRIISAIVVVASTVAIAWGFRHPELRGTSTTLGVYSAIMVIPASLTLFFNYYGDPGPDCTIG